MCGELTASGNAPDFPVNRITGFPFNSSLPIAIGTGAETNAHQKIERVFVISK